MQVFNTPELNVIKTDDDSDSQCSSDTKYSLKSDLAHWAKQCDIPLPAVTKLLTILGDHQIDVPSDATDLLDIPAVSTFTGIGIQYTIAL